MGIFPLFASAGTLEADIRTLGIRVVLVSSVALLLLVFIAGLAKNKSPKLRLPLFLLIAFTIVVSTVTLFGSTIYLNTKSESGGPVHWHADFEAWACGVQLELRNPSGFLSNKIGNPTLHEHNDQRIHLEGVVVKKATDATLGHFMNVVGGSISSEMISFPLADGIIEDEVDGDEPDSSGHAAIDGLITTDALGKKSFVGSKGETCAGQEAEPQVFVYKFNESDKTYAQTKLKTPSSYVIRDESVVPPADCIIMEFAPTKPKTERLCEQYGIRDKTRCAEFGVSGWALKDCDIEEYSLQQTGESQ